MLLMAALLFVAITAVGTASDDPATGIAPLFAFPVALIALERGMWWGLGSAAVAIAVVSGWQVMNVETTLGGIDYVTRSAAALLLGGLVGAASDRIRAVSGEASRFWSLSSDLLAAADLEGRFRSLNPAWERALGWPREELLAKPYVDFVHPDDRRATIEVTERLRAGGEVVNFKNRYRCRDGSYRTLQWSATGVTEDERIYAVARDVTDLVLTDQRLHAAIEDAERANRAKSEFLSRMSHELRTPLNAVIGFGQLLELEDLDPDQRDSVEQILQGGRHLMQLIDEILDISRIEAGTISLSLEPVDASALLAESLALIKPLATRDGVELVANPRELDHTHLLGDRQRLKQVLINVLSNAVKYNRRGGKVSVTVERPDAERVRISIADTGRGISPERLEQLFTPFERLGAEGSDIEGTGLGLTLSKRLLESMGGTIEPESEPGAGTTMRIELQAAAAPEDIDPTTSASARNRDSAEPADQHTTVLYIEDDASNLRLVERALATIPGVRLIPATHGALGIELARRHRPDAILLDLHLPDLDGERVLKRLKEDPDLAPIPVTVLSADAIPAHVERLRAAGAAGYLTKPIDVEELLNLVRVTRR
jgi:PAS domain S-box-containing protein